MEAKDRKKGKRKTWETKTCREGKRMGKNLEENQTEQRAGRRKKQGAVIQGINGVWFWIDLYLLLPHPALLATFARFTLHAPCGQSRQGTALRCRGDISGQPISARQSWIYTYWILLVTPLCSTHALSPLPSHLFSQNLGDCVISCCAAPPPGLAAISKQVIKGGLTNSRRPWQMDQLYKPYFLRHPGWKEDKPWGTGIMLRVKGKSVGRWLKGRARERKTKGVATRELKGKGTSSGRWWCSWMGSGAACQQRQRVLKGESPGAARMLCNDSSAWEKEAGGNCPEWQEEREKVGEWGEGPGSCEQLLKSSRGEEKMKNRRDLICTKWDSPNSMLLWWFTPPEDPGSTV